MNDNNNMSIIPVGSTGLIRVGNSIEITNKIISEHEERLLQRAFTTVKIGNQEWMTKNLDVDCYANGDTIPQVQNPKEWEQLKTGAWCYYNNDPENGKLFGKLYNWYAVNDPRGLVPNGWKIPSDRDWRILIDCLGGIYLAGTKMKSNSGWKINDNGTNESGFSGLPGGWRDFEGLFAEDIGSEDIGSYGYWWSSTEINKSIVWSRLLSYDDGLLRWSESCKQDGLSVRCLRDLFI
jgi:uncharacterized protein (TIGR02145 family)